MVLMTFPNVQIKTACPFEFMSPAAKTKMSNISYKRQARISPFFIVIHHPVTSRWLGTKPQTASCTTPPGTAAQSSRGPLVGGA